MARKKRYQWDVEGGAQGDMDGETQAKASVSRSQKKRDSTALQDLGKALTELPLAKLAQLPLTDDLREALTLMARLTDREGRRRQLQYIGRLMREADGDAIAAAYARLRQGHVEDTALLHHAEKLRATLLTADAAERARLLAPWPEAAAEVAHLIDTARREDSPDAAGAYRALFRRLRALLQEGADEA